MTELVLTTYPFQAGIGYNEMVKMNNGGEYLFILSN